MSSLADLQKRFAAYVLADDRLPLPALVPEIADQRGVGVERRLDVYHQAYRLRLLEVLGTDFPGLRQLLGERFKAVGLAYIGAQASPHFNLRWYAQRLPVFLGTSVATQAEPALAEMASLEWALTLVFDAPDQVPVSLTEMAARAPTDWPDLCFDFADALQLLPLQWNVAAIRRAIDQDEVPPDLQALPASELQAVWRQDLRVRHRALPADEAAALIAARDGACFAELCVVLCHWHAETAVALRAAELLKTWIHDQWISQLRP